MPRFALRVISLAGLLVAVACGYGAKPPLITPGDPVDYGSQAFYPQRWKQQDIDPMMVPWKGREVAFLTVDADLDRRVMTGLLAKLDEGWNHYGQLTGKSPRTFKQVDGMPTMVAIPKMELTCGYGCGYVGATGIELGAFYRHDYENITADPKAIPDYYFYEMGRNYYTFGDQHSLFVTGFAVFMRYVCLDELGLKSGQPTRRIIESAESIYADSEIPFLKAFTNHDGLTEKQNRLRDADGKSIRPSDQPVMYASAMLRLRRDHGGDAWVERFFRHLAACPNIKPTDQATALKQSYNWLVAASCAAGEDLSPLFADEWRMPLTPAQRTTLATTDWRADDLDAASIVQALSSPTQ